MLSELLLGLALLGFLNPDDVGTTALPMLKVGAGPRACAMGETFTALSDDVTALYWNPAGLGQVKYPGYFLSHQEFFQDVRTEYLALVTPAGAGQLGVGATWWRIRGVEEWDAENMPVRLLNPWTGIMTVGYGVQVYPSAGRTITEAMSAPKHGRRSTVPTSLVYVGGALKGVFDDLDGTTSGLGAGADVGVLARPWEFLSLGLTVNNFGRAYYANSGGYYDLPASVNIGLAFHIGTYGNTPLHLLAEAVLPFDNRAHFHFGGEYTAFNVITIRGGFRTGPQDIATLGWISGLCLGFGLRWAMFGDSFVLDHAYVPYGSLGSTHRLSLNVAPLPRQVGNLTIVVLDSISREPLPAELELSGLVSQRLTLDRKGKIVLTKLEEGYLRVSARYEGYVPVARVDSFNPHHVSGPDQKLEIRMWKPKLGTVWGTITDSVTGRGIPGRVEYEGKTRGICVVKEPNWTYVLPHLDTGAYRLIAYGPSDDYLPETSRVEVRPDRVTVCHFRLKQRVKRYGTLCVVEFAFDQATIDPQYWPKLDEVARTLASTPSLTVEIAGHTDSSECNTRHFETDWALSEARADAVRDYLIKKSKIKARRLIVSAHADTRWRLAEVDKSGQAINWRRVEVIPRP